MSTPYYQDEHVTLWHGDCLEVTAWLEADVLVTDPPYGQDYAPTGLHSRADVRLAARPTIAGDGDTGARDTALLAWGRRPAVIFGTWRLPLPPGATPRHRLIWHKAGRKPGVSPHPWFPTDEEIWLIGDGWQGKPRGTVITTTEAREREPARVGHPTPKPVGLMTILVEKAPPGAIADPFAGSGSTLVAAAALGRRAIGVELDERYCEIAAKRLAQGVLDFGEVSA